MKKLYDKDEIWFAIMWIILYVIGFANADAFSDTIGMPKLLTVIVGFIMITILYGFITKHGLADFFGLCSIRGIYKDYAYFIPLVIISSVNLWNGMQFDIPFFEMVLFVISMCFVGILEEIIFRGFLFKGMCKTHVVSAIVVSSVTFGMGHAINLFLGAPVFETILQLIYASAIGFCYTAVFYASGSILPCIVSHAVVNSTSLFSVEPTQNMQILITIIQTILGVGYGVWLLKKKKMK